MNKRMVALGIALILVLGGGLSLIVGRGSAPETEPAASAPAGMLSATQVQRLGIRTEAAEDAGALPLGTVPGVVTLPPDARVAVTAPFAGTAVRVLVIQGQQVARGQALAVVRAAEPVQFGAELARAEAELPVVGASAARLAQLAKEGVVAQARADEAQAALRRVQATVAEHRRLLALGGAGADGTATLRAPIAGRIATAAIETGGPVGGMTAPFVVENSAALSLDLQLPERLAGRIHPGMGVEVALPRPQDGAPVVVGGRILSVAASLDPVHRSIPAKASIGAAPGLVPGKSLMVVIKGQGTASGVAIPSRAVTRSGDDDQVFVRMGDRFARRSIVIAGEMAGRTIVSEGLKAGEQVAVAGVAELKSLLAEQ